MKKAIRFLALVAVIGSSLPALADTTLTPGWQTTIAGQTVTCVADGGTAAPIASSGRIYTCDCIGVQNWSKYVTIGQATFNSESASALNDGLTACQNKFGQMAALNVKNCNPNN